MLCWHSCSEWGREHVSPFVDYEGGQYIQNRQWHMKVNILQFIVGHLTATINSNTQKADPEIGIDGSSQTQQNPQVDW